MIKILSWPQSLIERLLESIDQKIRGRRNVEGTSEEKGIFWVLFILQAIFLVVVFCVSKDKLKTFLNAFYCTTPGGILELILAPYEYGMDTIKEAFLHGRNLSLLKDIYLGDHMHWLVTGVQDILVMFYLKHESRVFGNNKMLTFLHTLLSTFTIGTILSFLLEHAVRITGSIDTALRSIPVLRYIYMLLAAGILLFFLLMAISKLLENIKLYFKTLPMAFLSATGILFVVLGIPYLIIKVGAFPSLYDDENDLMIRLIDLAYEDTRQPSTLVVLFLAGGVVIAYLTVVARKHSAKKKTQDNQ